MIITRSCRLAEITWLFVSQNHRELCASILQDGFWIVHIIIIIIIIIIPCKFFTTALPRGFSLKWQQVSTNIQDPSLYLLDLKRAAVWMVSSHLPITNSPSFLSSPLRIIWGALITIGITLTFIFHNFFLFSILVWFGLVPLFNGISTFVSYLMPKSFS